MYFLSWNYLRTSCINRKASVPPSTDRAKAAFLDWFFSDNSYALLYPEYPPGPPGNRRAKRCQEIPDQQRALKRPVNAFLLWNAFLKAKSLVRQMLRAVSLFASSRISCSFSLVRNSVRPLVTDVWGVFCSFCFILHTPPIIGILGCKKQGTLKEQRWLPVILHKKWKSGGWTAAGIRRILLKKRMNRITVCLSLYHNL